MVLATREDAQFLSDAVQGDGDPLSVLQEFERSPRPTLEELKPFEYEILSDLTTSMMYIVGHKVLLKLEEKMNSDEARALVAEFAKSLIPLAGPGGTPGMSLTATYALKPCRFG